MFEYYYGNQTETFNFVRVPWVLFTHPAFERVVRRGQQGVYHIHR